MSKATLKKQLKSERIQILNEIDKNLVVCKTCPKRDNKLSAEETCKGCKIYKQLKRFGKQLEGTPRTEIKVKQRRFTKEEDDLIIKTAKSKGFYKGFYLDISKQLDRDKGTIRSRVRKLTLKGII